MGTPPTVKIYWMRIREPTCFCPTPEPVNLPERFINLLSEHFRVEESVSSLPLLEQGFIAIIWFLSK